MDNKFYSQKAYIKRTGISSAKEDTLEMIFRLCSANGYARISDIEQNLNVSVSSVSKTAASLKESGFIDYKKYGIITLTPEGRLRGKYLLKRHDIINKFFCFINNSENELVLTEQIEHYFDEKTVQNLEDLLAKLITNL